MLRIGTAGWVIPKARAAAFPPAPSHLRRYAAVFNGVEINSSFHAPHRHSTYERWAASVADGFRFAVKMPREITHVRKLLATDEPMATFLSEARALGPKLGPLLVQLPPSLAFDARTAGAFFDALRTTFDGDVVCEPRHRSWFTEEADSLLKQHRVPRVAADPAIVEQAAIPGGWPDLAYHRLHGTPRMYYSAYPAEVIASLAARLTGARQSRETWCMFDNTAAGAAAGDALDLSALCRRLNVEPE